VNERIQAFSAKFAALQQREKVMVAATAIFVICMGGYSLWVEPAKLHTKVMQQQIVQQTTELQGLQTQVAGMKAQLTDPDAPNKAALADVKTRLVAADQALHAYDNTLVPPERVPQLLQALVARHRGIELLSLQTLPPTPLLAPAAKADDKAGVKPPDAKAPPAPPVKGGNIHKHGIEIRMAGNYLDLLAYVADLESLPQKLLWGNMALTVTAYPRSELTLTVYTLSLDPTWLVV
jgi:MSHA biogenesis protein MshJ